MNNLFEFIYCLSDNIFLLYAFSKFNSLRSKKFLLFNIMAFSLIQYLLTFFSINRFVDSIRDAVLLIMFLFVSSKYRDEKNILYAMIIDILFGICLSLSVTVFYLLGADIEKTLEPGIYRFIFTIVLKSVTYLSVYSFTVVIKKMHEIFDNSHFLSLNIFFIIFEVVISMLLQYSETNEKISLVMVVLIIVMISSFTIFVHFITYLKQKNEIETINNIIDAIERQTILAINEQINLKIYMHDLKIGLDELYENWMNRDSYKIETSIKDLLLKHSQNNKNPLCSNLYVDSIIKQYMEKYKLLKFDLRLFVPVDIGVKAKDLLSLIVCTLNIITNGTNEYDQSTVKLDVLVKRNELYIHAVSIKKYNIEHDINYKIMEDIVNRYDGCIDLNNDEVKAILFFNNDPPA